MFGEQVVQLVDREVLARARDETLNQVAASMEAYVYRRAYSSQASIISVLMERRLDQDARRGKLRS